jgi:Fe-S-cluster containining protein
LTKNKQICDECIKETGGCCTAVEISLHIDELEVFKNRFANNPPKGHTLEIHDDETDVYLYSSQDDPCMFLNSENKCSIYEKRPLICRMYPIMWEGEDNLNYFADFACPLAHMIPTREMNLWQQDPRNKGYIEKMGELDFTSTEPQYVNLTVITEEVDPPYLLDHTYDV